MHAPLKPLKINTLARRSTSIRPVERHDEATNAIHNPRHPYASRALALGESLTMIGKLLGHSDIETTAGYAHLDDAHLVEAAEKVGSTVADAMESEVRLR